MDLKQKQKNPTLALIALLLLSAACARQKGIEDCPRPVDQEQLNSFKPPLDWSPSDAVTVRIDERFTGGPWGERSAIIEALEEWNSFSSPVLGGAFFRPVVQDISDQISVSALGSAEEGNLCGAFEGNGKSYAFVRVKSEEEWANLGFSEQTNAVTLTCTRGKELDKVVVLFNATGDVQPNQVRSIALHEAGHTLGLQHSCCRPDQGEVCSKNFLQCSSLEDQDHPYRKAVMYPTLSRMETELSGFSRSEEKNVLTENDEHRAFCRYHHLGK